MRALLAAATFAVLALPGTTGAMGVSPCAPAGLHATFTHIAGSDGAGHTSYAVGLRNTSGSPCTVSGRPGLKLETAGGRALPTKVTPDRPGTGTAVLITLASGARAHAGARFSPDIPSGSEPTTGACEKRAAKIRVTLASPGQGSLTAKVSPPTPVCGHGAITLSLLRAG